MDGRLRKRLSQLDPERAEKVLAPLLARVKGHGVPYSRRCRRAAPYGSA